MGITNAVKSRFSRAVRQRGQEYAQQGAVRIANVSQDFAELEVRGSRGRHYDVFLEIDADGDFDLECTCPHYDDGYYCKHIWAAAIIADENEFFGKSSLIRSGRGNGKSSHWKNLLSSKWDRPKAPTVDLGDDHSPRQVYYLLETAQDADTPTINLYQRQRKQDGEWGKIKPLNLSAETLNELVAPDDRHTLELLFGTHVNRREIDRYDYYAPSTTFNSSHSTEIEVRRALFDTIFSALAETGRFQWLLAAEQGWDDARTLAWVPKRTWSFRVRTEPFDRGRKWRLSGEIICGNQVRPASDIVQWYSAGLLLMDDQLQPFQPTGDLGWIDTLRRTEHLIVPKADQEELLKELWRTGNPPEIIGDDSLRQAGITGVPVGRLVIHPPIDTPSYARHNTLYASVAYRYGEHEATPHSQVSVWPNDSGDGMVLRDLSAEERLLRRLYDHGLSTKEISYYGQTPPGHLQFSAKRLEQIVATLVEEGWIVESDGVRVRGAGSLSVSVNSGIDWFDLDAEMDFDGELVKLPELLSAVRAGQDYVTLGDGSRGLLPTEWLARYAPLADVASSDENDGQLRFQTSQALLLDSLLANREANTTVKFDRQFSNWRKRLETFKGVKPANPSRTFRGSLRDYQQEGLGWLKFLEKFGFGGCLADDMGLGKTVQVLALLADRRRRRPKDSDRRTSLVVAPKSLVYNWKQEAARFAPKLLVADYTGVDRKLATGDLSEYDLVITTYGTLRREAAELGEMEWDYVILDEAQAIKNSASQSAKACRLLVANHRLALSGTPVENHLGELWSIFEFLNPGLLGKSKSFQKLHKGKDEERQQKLTTIRKGLAPFLLRRTKQQVLPQLPKKTEQSLYCDLTPPERKRYNELRDHYRALLSKKIVNSSLAKAKIHVLEALLRLRQAACHQGLIDERQKGKPSSKLTLLFDQLKEVVQEGHKALIFSQFTTMLDIVRKQLETDGIDYEYLDGKTRKRQVCVDRFQNDDTCQVFLISLKAGGCGLNLTAADYVFVLDPWWNPAVEAQAIDRAHRIGQSRPVFAYRLIARNTVEEKILEMQANKRELADAIITENISLLKSLSAEDLQYLLG